MSANNSAFNMDQEMWQSSPDMKKNHGWRNLFTRKTNNHVRLPYNTSTPTISTCTTATNLSSLDSSRQNLVKPNSFNMTEKLDNPRYPQEIEPLNIGDKKLIEQESIETFIIEIQEPNKRVTTGLIKQVIAAISVSLVSMMVGYSSAYTSPALVSMNATDSTLTVTKDEASWICSLMPLFALLGGILGGPLIEYMGRKMTIISTAILFILSWVLIAAASNVWYLYAGRSFAGISVGVASLALPVYLGETIQPEVRGTLGLLPTALGNIGILVCFVVGNYVPWNMLAIVGMVPALPFTALAFLIPETPRWYISKGADAKAVKSLKWLRGADANVDDEFSELKKTQIEAEKLSNNNAFNELFQKPNLKPLLISLGLMLFQQLSGINAVIFYTVTIFQDAGSSIDENLCTIIVGIVNFLSTFVATILIDRLGRKVLLYISNVCMIFTLMTLGTFFYMRHVGYNLEHLGWLPLASFVIFVIGFSLGFGPIPWLMMGEILPSKVRGSAASIVTAFNWACTFLVTKTFIDITSAIGSYGAFWLFGCVCCVGMFFIVFCVPETQGQSLEEIEKKMTDKQNIKVRRMSSRANMKPTPL